MGKPLPNDGAVVYDLPLRIESVANKREHWGKRAERTKLHRFAAIAVQPHPLPCVVTLVRIAPRALDDDNLVSGFKALRDGIAKRLGVDDRDPRVRFVYDQRRGRAKEYAARVEIRGAA
jgi:hypothetical protein